MDRRLRERLRDLPTEQDPNAQKENPALQNHHHKRSTTFPTNRYGLDHRTTPTQRVQRNPHHRRSRMLARRNIPSMFDKHHGPWNSPSLFGQRLPMVRTPHKSHQRPRPALYIAIRKSPCRTPEHSTEPIVCISSPNRRVVRTKEPMDRAIPTPNHHGTTRRLDRMAIHCISSPQQSAQRHHWTIAQSSPTGLRNQIVPIRT
jgi:hypothetical protein